MRHIIIYLLATSPFYRLYRH